MTDKWFSSCIAFISCFFLVYGQETTKVVDNKSQTQILYLKTTWDGHLLTNKTDIVPVSFCAQPSGDSKNIIVSFNSTGITNDEQKFFSPDVFGILFKGENNAILQVEVVKGGASKVELFYGFDKPLDPKAKLEVKYQEIPSKVANTTTWNASIEIPIEYFARGTNQLTAYTNFSQGPDHDVKVLTLLPFNKQQQSVLLPNLLKQEFFMDHVIKADFTKWSNLWQNLIKVSPGGTMMNQTEESQQGAIKQDPKNPKNSNNEGSIIEQGLVTWILISAIFCGMLHIFVLAL